MTTTPIRVGFCLHAMQVAGAEVLVTQIMDRLRGEIEPTIFCLDYLGQLGEELQAAGIPVVVFERKTGIDWDLSSRFAKELNARKIDVLHAHQYTPFFYGALARLRGAKARIIMTEHGRHYPDIVSWKRKWMNQWILTRFANHSTACCRFSAEALESKDGFRNVEVVYNGIDLASHPGRTTPAARDAIRESLGLSPQLKYIVCIARFHPVKDHETLIRGFALAAKSASNMRLVLVGSGPEQERIRSLTRDLGIENLVEFWGVRRDISQILQAMDGFTLTSVSEAASLTLLEAMANECPVAVTDVGGNGEHIDAGVHGLLSPRKDPGKLADNLTFLVQNDAAARKFATAARNRVEVQFRLENAVERYAQLYRQFQLRDRAQLPNN
ncbi:MAG: glycosyltransferase [Planctomycetes bacterium]|nr:glycosyltransferase [Planctomycetota bacterium]